MTIQGESFKIIIITLVPITIIHIIGSYADINLINNNPIITTIVTMFGSFRYIKYFNYKRRKTFIKDYSFPESLMHTLLKEYPHLNRNQAEEIIESLRQLFIKHSKYNWQPTNISHAIDYAWKSFHEMEQMYSQFCGSAFTKVLPYTPLSESLLEAFNQNNVQKLWVDACQDDGIDPLFPDRLPTIFFLDEKLTIPNNAQHFIENASFSHLLDISLAVSPSFIAREVVEKLSTNLSGEKLRNNRAYLTNKIKFYLNSEKWITAHSTSEMSDLFRTIEDNDDLIISLFGKFSFLGDMRRQCTKIKKDYDNNNACGSSGAAR
jgi:hypothetical protein